MGIAEWLGFSVAGALVDSILCTIFYHKKIPIRRYWLLLILLVCISIGMRMIAYNEVSKITSVVLIALTIFLFTRNKASLVYLLAGYMVIILVECVVMQITYLDFYKSFFIVLIIKMFISSRATEYALITHTGSFLSITIKNIAIISLFIIIAICFCYTTMWRW